MSEVWQDFVAILFATRGGDPVLAFFLAVLGIACLFRTFLR